MSPLFAFLHHLAAFGLVAALAIELVLVKDAISARTARTILAADRIYGIAAGALIVVGFLRVFYLEKGPTYYFHTWTFSAKLTLFIIVGLLSIIPTMEFLSWRTALKQGQAPTLDARKLRRLCIGLAWKQVRAGRAGSHSNRDTKGCWRCSCPTGAFWARKPIAVASGSRNSRRRSPPASAAYAPLRTMCGHA